jgi:hypothetical protein
MTPKEKAEELYSKFEDNIQGIEGYEWWESAKQCALIAVDELLNDDWYITTFENNILRKKYWEEVKQEIKEL